MSGFGLRALKKESKEKIRKDSRFYFDHIVIGDDHVAAATFFKLLKNNPDKKVKIISSSVLNKQSVLNELKCNISTIRDKESANALISKKAALEVLATNNEPLFYKDTKLHSFKGRAKPHELMEDEDQFQSAYYNFKWLSLFEESDLESFDDIILAHQYNKFIEGIELTEPEDLVEVTNFKIFTSENEVFECEQLHFCQNPKSFYKIVKDKDTLDLSLHQYCNKLESRTSLTVNYESNQNFYESSGTVYLPQSVTHDWGHFITDIKPFDPATNTQEITALMFVTEEITTEEDLAKKIRLMKRVIDRVFPIFAKSEVKEFINYRVDSFIKNNDDSLSETIQKAHPNLKFYGQGAYLDMAHKDLKYMVRSILSL